MGNYSRAFDFLVFEKKENRCYLQNFSVFLEKVFSVYTTPLPRRDASSIHLRSKKTQTNLYVFFVRSFSGIFVCSLRICRMLI